MRTPPKGFRILIFHDVPEPSFPAFTAFVEYLVRTHGVISPEDAASRLAGGAAVQQTPGRHDPYLLSFDDGFAGNFKLANQILSRFDIQALFFICPGLVELDAEAQRRSIAANVFQGRAEATDLQLMSWAELRELSAAGHSIGCHGMTHKRLAGLDDKGLDLEILSAADLLAERMAAETPWFAYPFGDIESIDPEAMAKIKGRFMYCRSGIRGINTATTTPAGILAEELGLNSAPAYMKLVLEGGLDFRYRSARQRLMAMI